jgi:hypothetical protein
MAFANISLVSTFTEWISRFNQVLTVVNTSIEGLMNTSGTITITNPTGLNGNVSLNVANGVIKGDAGLLSNVRTSALSANSINVSSNTAAIAIYKTNNGRLGSEIFVSMNVSTSLADNSTANVASAQSTNTLNSLLVTSYGVANDAAIIASAAFVAANAAGVGASNIAIGAFSLANTHTSQISNTSNIAVAAFAAANAAGPAASNTALGAFNLANTVNTIAIAAFAKANTANSIAVGAFDKANTANSIAVGAFAKANSSLQTSDLGMETIWVPVGAMMPTGASFTTRIIGGSTIAYNSMLFDPSTVQTADFVIQMPKSWNEGNVNVSAVWMHPTTTTNFDVVWGFNAAAISNDETANLTFSNVTKVLDTGGTANSIYMTPEGILTIDNTPAAEDLVVFRIYRDAANVSDNIAVNTRLVGVKIKYTVNSLKDD